MNGSSDGLSGVAAAGFASVMLVFGIVFMAVTVFFVWLFWRVFERTGQNGALGLLCLIPSFGPLICMLLLAFSRWPIEDRLAAHGYEPGLVPPVVPPPPPAAPGSSMLPG